MADASWLSYVGAISGVVGTISGGVGAVLGYKGYRRSVRVRTLDLRLQLRKDANELRSVVGTLPEFLDYAHKSRSAVAATGFLGGAGNMQVWRQEWEKDTARAKELAALTPGVDADFAGLSESEIETKHVEFHELSLRCTQLREKYELAVASDDRIREEIRARSGRIGG